MIKRVLNVGNYSIWWSTNTELSEAINRDGVEVYEFDYASPVKQFSHSKRKLWFIVRCLGYFRRYRYLEFISDLYYKIYPQKEINQKLIQIVEKEPFDLIVLNKVDGISPKTIKVLKKYSTVWYFFMDPYDEFKRVDGRRKTISTDIFSTTFKEILTEAVNFNINSIWLLQGFDPKRFKRIDYIKKYDVVFAGSYTKKRSMVINFLKNNGIEIYCLGSGFKNPPLYGEDLNKIYNKARIILNLNREKLGYSVRVAQAMGSGSFVLSENAGGLKEFFCIREDLDIFESQDELLDKIKFYLSNYQKREAIAKKGMEKVHSQLSWDAVWKKMKGYHEQYRRRT